MGFCHLAQLSDIALLGAGYIFRHEAGFCPVAADEPNPCTVKGFSKKILRTCANQLSNLLSNDYLMTGWWISDDCLSDDCVISSDDCGKMSLMIVLWLTVCWPAYDFQMTIVLKCDLKAYWIFKTVWNESKFSANLSNLSILILESSLIYFFYSLFLCLLGRAFFSWPSSNTSFQRVPTKLRQFYWDKNLFKKLRRNNIS